MGRKRAIIPAALVVALLSCDSPATPDPQPAQVLAFAGTPQTGVTEDPLAEELVARVVDDRGRGVPAVPVAWTVVDAGGGALSASSAMTDTAGKARVQWTLGAAPGSYTVRATVQGLAPATFTATAAWPAAAQMEILAGNGQDGAPAGLLADSLAVKVTSEKGRPVPQATVTWTVSGGGGTVSSATATTNNAGIARVAWTLGAPGPNAVTATVGSLPPVSFSAYAVPVASITFAPAQPVVVRGDTLRITATARDSVGNPLPGRVVTWSTTAPAVVPVSADGVVTGAGRGTATITAASEGRSASVTVTVAQRPPRVTGLDFAPDPVVVGPSGGSVDVRVSARADAGLRRVYVMLHADRGDPPGEQLHPCDEDPAAPVSGTSEQGTWACRVQLPARSAGGTWRINVLSVVDSAGVVTNYTGQELADAGMDITVQVQSANEDVTAPTLTALEVSPTTVNVSGGIQYVQFRFAAADAGSGMFLGNAYLLGPGGSGGGCATDPDTGEGAASSTFTCSVGVPADAPAGVWRVEIILLDVVRNQRWYTTAQLQAAGFPHQITVTR